MSYDFMMIYISEMNGDNIATLNNWNYPKWSNMINISKKNIYLYNYIYIHIYMYMYTYTYSLYLYIVLSTLWLLRGYEKDLKTTEQLVASPRRPLPVTNMVGLKPPMFKKENRLK